MSLVSFNSVLAQMDPTPVRVVNQGSGTRDAVRQLEKNLLPAIATSDSNVIKAIHNTGVATIGQLSRLNDNLELRYQQEQQSADWEFWKLLLLGGILLTAHHFIRNYSSRRGSLLDEVFIDNEELHDDNSAFARDNAIAVKTGNNSPVTINQFGKDVVPQIVEEITFLVFISDEPTAPVASPPGDEKEKTASDKTEATQS